MVIWEEVWNRIVIENKTLKEGEVGLRGDGRIEWIDSQGCGHTVWVEPKHAKQKAWWTHGCNGKCDCEEFKALKERLKKALG